MMTAANIHYEPADRVRGLAASGIDAIFLLAQKIELDKENFFYITNDREMSAAELVFSANDRCDQENLLKTGVHALTTPVDNLVSNWAYMVMAGWAWSLNAWIALLVPVTPRHEAKHQEEKRTLLRMEFATYCAAFFTDSMGFQEIRVDFTRLHAVRRGTGR